MTNPLFMEVIMSTTSITHRPTSLVTAAAAVLALAAGGMVLAESQQSDAPSAPAQHSGQTQEQPTQPKTHRFHATTTGGHVMVGL
jgi:hypothetical protein